MSRVATTILVLVSVLYPTLVYFSIEKLGPAMLGLGLCLMAVIKMMLQKGIQTRSNMALLGLSLVYGLIILIFDETVLITLYPVLVSWALGVIFLLSTYAETSLIEQFARKMGQVITPNAKRYTRKLSGVWAVFLFLNGVVALCLGLFFSFEAWALYCGLISYLLIGLLVGSEWIYRRYYVSKYGA